jgi:hypothetical protein
MVVNAGKGLPTAMGPDCKTYPQLTTRDLSDKFLDWVELHRSADTYHDYRH